MHGLRQLCARLYGGCHTDERGEQKAVIKYQEDCMVCGYCELDCPEDAIILTPEKFAPLPLAWC
ncbi:MAG: 4Fe-4S binding protein [bacterium]